MREGQLAEQLLQHCWRANISVGKAVRRVFIAPNTQCSVGCPALTQGSAWAGFDLSGMSPLGGRHQARYAGRKAKYPGEKVDHSACSIPKAGNPLNVRLSRNWAHISDF